MDIGQIGGHIYDIQGYSVHDGPGIRTTVFTKGCPLRCIWCHSPESQNYTDELSYMSLKCIGTEKCGLCIKACPNDAIYLNAPERSLQTDEMITKVLIDRKRCDNCLKCARECPADALQSTGYDMTVDEVLKRVLLDKTYFGDDGGITISGGEPMTQFEFTCALAVKSRQAGIGVCIDTTGYCEGELFDRIIMYTDLFLYDLKHMDSVRHKALTGVPNEKILENAIRIAQHGGKLQIRVPVVPKLNADMENMRRTIEYCLELGDALKLVQLLPYHRMGIPKYERLDWTYRLVNVDPPDDEFMEERLEMFLGAGLTAQIH